MGDFINFFTNLFDTSHWPARWHCGVWTPFHGWLYIISDFGIWAAYSAIPLTLVYLLRKKKNIAFPGIVWLFVAFILLCGLTHLVDAGMFWFPMYKFSALLRFVTATVSWVTVFALIKILPFALSLKTPEAVKKSVEEQTFVLQESTQMLKGLVDNSPDLISVVNRDLRYTFLNAKALEISNFTHKVGSSIEELGYGKDFLASHIQALHKVFDENKIHSYEYKFQGINEVDVHMLFQLVPICEHEKVTHVMTITKDLTKIYENISLKTSNEELKKLSEKLKVQNQQLENFADIASHNLRSPVANMVSLLDLVEACNTEENQKINNYLKDVSQSMMRTVDSLYEAVKIRHELENNNFHSIELRTVLKTVQERLGRNIEDSNAQINADFSASTQVNFPKGYLENIFEHLLSNSLKYKRENIRPVINIKSSKTSDFVQLVFTDNGCGIDIDKYQDKLFKLHRSISSHSNSAGVGLFTIKSIIESIGGQVEIASIPMQGTTISLRFKEPQL